MINAWWLLVLIPVLCLGFVVGSWWTADHYVNWNEAEWLE